MPPAFLDRTPRPSAPAGPAPGSPPDWRQAGPATPPATPRATPPATPPATAQPDEAEPARRAGATSPHEPAVEEGRPESEREDPEATKTRIKDTFEVLAQNANPATAATVGERFTDPAFSTPTSYQGGIYAPFGAGLAAGFALWLNYESIRAVQRDEAAGQAGTARHREGTRERQINLGEAAQNASNMLGNIVNGVGGSLNFAGYSPEIFNAVLSAGGALALPAGVVQAGRFARKAARARTRVQALRALMAAEDQDPRTALNAAGQEVEAQRELVDALDEAAKAKNAEFSASIRELMDRPPADQARVLDRLMPLLSEAEDLRRQRQDAEVELQAARERATQRQEALRAMDEALTSITEEVRRPGRSDFVTLRMIQAYALKKNRRGVIKKIINFVSGTFTAAGATATLVATIAIAAGTTAGAGVLLATPVGWGLVATATATALGLGSYQAWKYLAKRWKWTAEHGTGGQRSVFQRLGATLAIWKRVGPSKRAEYATALHRMAGSRNPVLAAEARRTIAALGLDWDRLSLGDDPESAIKLIAAKMVSFSTLPSAPIPAPESGRDTGSHGDPPARDESRPAQESPAFSWDDVVWQDSTHSVPDENGVKACVEIAVIEPHSAPVPAVARTMRT